MKGTFDLTDWELGDWTKELLKTAEVEVDRDEEGIEVHVWFRKATPDAAEKIVRKIGEEVLAAFFDTDLKIEIGTKGVRIFNAAYTQELIVPWEDVTPETDDDYIFTEGFRSVLTNLLHEDEKAAAERKAK